MSRDGALGIGAFLVVDKGSGACPVNRVVPLLSGSIKVHHIAVRGIRYCKYPPVSSALSPVPSVRLPVLPRVLNRKSTVASQKVLEDVVKAHRYPSRRSLPQLICLNDWHSERSVRDASFLRCVGRCCKLRSLSMIWFIDTSVSCEPANEGFA